MRRRALLSATATALTVPLLAGCSRDDGGGGGGTEADDDGSGGGGGPYGMLDPGGPLPSAEDADGRAPARRRGRPALGPEPRGPGDGD